MYKLDHVILLVADLARAVNAYSSLGFTVDAGGEHSQQGTHNALVPVGDAYIEVLAVRDSVVARASIRGRAALDFLESHGPGAVGYVLSTPDVESDATRLRSHGIAFDGPADSERLTEDGRLLRWRIIRPQTAYPSILPMLVQTDVPYAERVGVSSPKHPNTAVELVALRFEVDDPEASAQSVAAYLGVPGERASLGLGGFTVDLVPALHNRGDLLTIRCEDVGAFEARCTAAGIAITKSSADLIAESASGSNSLGARLRVVA